jgi:ribosome maturation factor RimP
LVSVRCEFAQRQNLFTFAADSINEFVLEGTQSPLFVYKKMELSEQIKQMADRHFLGSTHFVLDVKVNTRMAPPKIVVVVDGDLGITIDECANLSRALSDSIHETNLLEDFTMEVTTPGVDQPLKLLRQYPKNIGRNLKVELKENEVVRGKLQQVLSDAIIIEIEGKEKTLRSIPFDQINKTTVTISFK